MTEPPEEPLEPSQAAIAWGIIVAGLVVVVFLLMNWMGNEAAKHTGQEKDQFIKFFLSAMTAVTGIVLLLVAVLNGVALVADAWRYAWSRIKRR